MANVVELIKADHRKVEELFAQYESNHDEEVAAEIVKELHAHAAAEESIVYPVMEAQGAEANELEDHAQREHDKIKEALSHVEAATDDKSTHMAKLKEVVEHHVKDEEDEFLPAFEEKLGHMAEELGNKWEEFKLNHPSV